jgi:hypothetical protein
MHDEVGNEVSSGPSFGHDDPVFAKEIEPTTKPTAHWQITSACLSRHPAFAYLCLVEFMFALCPEGNQ